MDKLKITECPLCESKTVISWREIRQHYKCPGCGLYWTEKKSNHIPDTKKKANHFVNATKTISNKKKD